MQPEKSSFNSSGMGYGSAALQKGVGTAAGGAIKNGIGEVIGMVKDVLAKGGEVHDYRGGGKVQAKSPTERATVPGNSYENDKIDAKLSDKEIVLPRSVTLSKDPVRSAADFVAKVIAKRKRSGAA